MFTYDNQGTSSYLIYKLEENETPDMVTMGMLTNNNIPGFIKTTFFQIDDEKNLRYDISSKVSAADFLQQDISKKVCLNFLGSIVNALTSAEDYMIGVENILLDNERIYVNVSTGEAELVCLPVVMDDPEMTDLHMYFKMLIFNMKFKMSEDTGYVARLMNYLNQKTFTLEEFAELIRSLDQEKGVSPKPQTPASSVLSGNNSISFTPAGGQSSVIVNPVVNPSALTNQKVSQPVTPEQAAAKNPYGVKVNNGVSQRPMDIPKPVTPVKNEPVQEEEDGGEKMSLFYLLQHYSKENAEIYKKQKEKEKAKSAAKSQAPVSASSAKSKSSAKPGFAIPGQNNASIPVQNNPAAAPKKAPVNAKPQVSAYQNSLPPVTPKPQQVNSYQGQAMDFGETVVLSNSLSQETVVLGPEEEAVQAVKPYLIRKKTGEQILIDKAMFRIGKEPNYADYCIRDNSAVSRSHATITTSNGKYFVTDTNSTNHTFVDDRMIQSNMQVEIQNGSKVRFANEDFEFRLI